MNSNDPLAAAPDATSAALLERSGLRLEILDSADSGALDAWLLAVARGFHGRTPSADSLAYQRENFRPQRATAVRDGDGALPVGTVSSWIADLSVPGGATIPTWAISEVTVAQTHRRRGIARSLLEAELRTAAAAGVPIASLTVSESTIYGRYGFAPAAMASNWTIDTRRVHWSGPSDSARVDYIALERFAIEAAKIHDGIRRGTPGDIAINDSHWSALTQQDPDDKDAAAKLRAVQVTDRSGSVVGVALFKLVDTESDFTQHVVSVDSLLSSSAEGYRVLWRFLCEMDLVHEIRAGLLALDEPLRWHLGDWRAAGVTTGDHHWLRILDVPAALGARRFTGPGRIALDITDDLGFAGGLWLLDVDAEGKAAVSSVADVPGSMSALAMSINDLAAIYLGGVSVLTLHAAARIEEFSPGSAADAERMFHSLVTPNLSLWY